MMIPQFKASLKYRVSSGQPSSGSEGNHRKQKAGENVFKLGSFDFKVKKEVTESTSATKESR